MEGYGSNRRRFTIEAGPWRSCRFLFYTDFGVREDSSLEYPMARNESEREDLLREATALAERAEWRVPGEPETVVAGFQRTGSFSVYFGSDPVYQFDSEQRLRRAFVGGRLYRSQGTTLAELQRVRGPDATELRRTDLSTAKLVEFLAAAAARLDTLRRALAGDAVEVIGQVPPDTDLRERVREYLTRLLERFVQISPALKR